MRSQFAKADSNNDGKVTKAEFGVLRVEEAFKLFDDNENGVITVDEFVASGGSKAAFAKLDQSGNGQITLGEAMASEVVMDSMLTTFYEADTNGDGVVTLAEALAYRQAVREYTGNNPRI
jgi:Ca2+-binding EF-hand superfamily protein